jgi:hypothetical protein
MMMFVRRVRLSRSGLMFKSFFSHHDRSGCASPVGILFLN